MKIHNYELTSELNRLIVMTFADDNVIIAKNRDSVISITEQTILHYREIEMQVNPGKSVVISIKNGKFHDPFVFSDYTEIRPIAPN